MNAGHNGYISGMSSDKKIRAIQLWQFLASKIFFRLSLLSNNKKVCEKCGTHTEFPFELDCEKIQRYHLSEYPVPNLHSDGYTYNYKNLKGCHKKVIK